VSERQGGRWESREDAKRARHTSIERYPGCIFMAFLAWTGSGKKDSECIYNSTISNMIF
jgi:hypothetical protein